MTEILQSVGDVLRFWRKRRRLSQLALALETDVSARHLSFVESGRSSATRDMLLRLAMPLDLSLREQQRLLRAGGYAQPFQERPLEAPELAEVLSVVKAVLAAHPQPRPPGETPRVEPATRSTKSCRPWRIFRPDRTAPAPRRTPLWT